MADPRDTIGHAAAAILEHTVLPVLPPVTRRMSPEVAARVSSLLNRAEAEIDKRAAQLPSPGKCGCAARKQAALDWEHRKVQKFREMLLARMEAVS